MKKRIVLCVATSVAWTVVGATLEDVTPITYEAFGAVGDGRTDDRKAIMAAHAAANEKGLPVRAKDGATYYMGCGGGTAIIRTDVDFGTATFIIDDTHVAKPNIRSAAFSIEPDEPTFAVTGLVKLVRGQKSLGVRLPKRCLLELIDNKVRRFIRWGRNQNNGVAQQEMIIADSEGRVDPATPLVWDFDHVTAVNAWPIDEKLLTVKGGSFTNIANQAESRYTYHSRGILVHRSNVRIEGLKHYVAGELDHGAPYTGFVCIERCANVTLYKCLFTARRTYETIGAAGKPVSMGSYGLTVGHAVNVSCIGCRQTTDIVDGRYWGLFGSNFCRNILFDDCVFSRFDAHMGVANATIRNSTLGYMGVQAIGFGTLLIENSTIRSRNALVSLRSDYGSSWKGDIIIRNCTYAPCNAPRDGVPPLLNGFNVAEHDYGYDCCMPRRFVVEGLTIEDAKHSQKQDLYVFGTFRKMDVKPVRPYPVTEEVVLRNVKTASGRTLKTSRNEEMFRDVKIISD